jgi:hypothetical protein
VGVGEKKFEAALFPEGLAEGRVALLPDESVESPLLETRASQHALENERGAYEFELGMDRGLRRRPLEGQKIITKRD